MYLVFDTETTDLFKPDFSRTDYRQGRVCQLAFSVFDKSFNEILCFNSLIRPHNWKISEAAFNRHHISQEMCEKYGIPMEFALSVFNAALDKVDHRIAHNIWFDSNIMDVERSFHNFAQFNPSVKDHCTMLATTNICKLPGKIPGKYKWPKLIEAYRHIFNKDFSNQHDAMFDVRACAAIFKWLIENKFVTLSKPLESISQL